eukprot:CAMPEP_0174822188 /NCGR_PEP_ID=MMETSP1107-20130205/14196_1 /TAXON_ID=36770 /ORGANISM="Paraphysomonas vestita, Strain GFlagA" /LENGTH=79 /DNA_ID=CAMNT_0016040493 /DNA_START=567 /DNA_END=806 /DNA_ORIENTATION=-
MTGFGGGNQPPPRDEGPSIADRFQNILKSFTSPFSSDTSKKSEDKGLLEEDDDEEEGVWEGGIQMETRPYRSNSESANL